MLFICCLYLLLLGATVVLGWVAGIICYLVGCFGLVCVVVFVVYLVVDLVVNSLFDCWLVGLVVAMLS